MNYFEKKYDLSSYRLDLPLVRNALAYWFSSAEDPQAPSLAKEMGNLEV